MFVGLFVCLSVCLGFRSFVCLGFRLRITDGVLLNLMRDKIKQNRTEQNQNKTRTDQNKPEQKYNIQLFFVFNVSIINIDRMVKRTSKIK